MADWKLHRAILVALFHGIVRGREEMASSKTVNAAGAASAAATDTAEPPTNTAAARNPTSLRFIVCLSSIVPTLPQHGLTYTRFKIQDNHYGGHFCGLARKYSLMPGGAACPVSDRQTSAAGTTRKPGFRMRNADTTSSFSRGKREQVA
jgi:hypothetical protein